MPDARTPLLRGGVADLDVIVKEDQSSFTIVKVAPEGDYRLMSGANGGGHVAFSAHPSPDSAVFPATETGHLAVPPG